MSQFSLVNLVKPSYSINKKIRLIELFGGVGSQAMALRNLGADFEHYKLCEWDIASIASYKAIHMPDDDTDYSKDLTKADLVKYLAEKGISSDGKVPLSESQLSKTSEPKLRTIYNNIMATHDIVNICTATGKDFEITDKDKYAYLMSWSYPCFVAGTLVLTKDGYVPIESVKVGTEVLTHTGNWHKVIRTQVHPASDIYEIKTAQSEPIKVTGNHPFYVRKRGSDGSFSDPTWVSVEELAKSPKSYFTGSVVSSDEIIPEFKDDSFDTTNINSLIQNEDFWYIVGVSLCSTDFIKCYSDSVVITVDAEDIERLADILTKFNVDYQMIHADISTKLNAYYKMTPDPIVDSAQCIIHDESFYNFFKYVPFDTLSNMLIHLPKASLYEFVSGYMSSIITHFDDNEEFCIGTMTPSESDFSYIIMYCVEKLCHAPYFCDDKNYTLEFPVSGTHTYKDAFYEDGYCWYPIEYVNTPDSDTEVDVYNLEVEEDQSYVVQNVIVHNCTSISLAGKREGMQEGSGTASSLGWEVHRVLDECKELNSLPDCLIMENVPQVKSSDNIQEFQRMCNHLNELGYQNYFQILDASDYGVAQHRERAFMVSILGDYSYTFPKTIELDKVMGCYLDRDVDESYFVNTKAAQNLVLDLQNMGKLDGYI